MKRVLALALALALALSVGVVAFADSTTKEIDTYYLVGDKYDGIEYFLAPGSTTNIAMNVYDDESGEITFYADDLWDAYEDGYVKVSFKATENQQYIKSAIFKKSGAGQLFLELKTVEEYLGTVPTVKFTIRLTFTKPSKIKDAIAKGEYRATTGVLPISGDELFGKDIVKTGAYIENSYTYKFGFDREFELKANAQTDFDYNANGAFKPYYLAYVNKGNYADLGNVTTAYYSDLTLLTGRNSNNDDAQYIHLKKGYGDLYTFSYADGEAYLEVKLSDQKAFNNYYSNAAVKAITAKYPDVDFQFWDWKGKPTFDFNADIELTVDEDEVGEEPVLYYFDGTTLTKVNADLEDGVFLFRSRQLGTYVAASKAISVTAPIETTAAGAAPAATNATGNPNTGVSDFVGVAVALAVVSMAAAGAVALKK